MTELNMHDDALGEYDAEKRIKRDLATRILEKKYKWRISQNNKNKHKESLSDTSNSSPRASFTFLGVGDLGFHPPPTPGGPPSRPRRLDDFSVLDVNEDECSMFTMRRSDGREGEKQ